MPTVPRHIVFFSAWYITLALMSGLGGGGGGFGGEGTVGIRDDSQELSTTALLSLSRFCRRRAACCSAAPAYSNKRAAESDDAEALLKINCLPSSAA